MAEPNDSNKSKSESSKEAATSKLRLAEGHHANTVASPSEVKPPPMTERIRLENIKAGARRGIPPVDDITVTKTPPEQSAIRSHQQTRLANIKESHAAGEKNRGRQSGGSTQPEDSESTEQEQVGALAVSQDSITLRPRRSKENNRGQGMIGAQNATEDQQVQQSGEADEEVGLESNETLVEAEVAPDVEALVQQRLEEERQNQQNNDNNFNNNNNNNEENVNVVVATATTDEDSNDDNKGKRLIQILVLVILLAAGSVVAALLLTKNDDPAAVPTSPPMFEANSVQACASISNKESVPNQDTMVIQAFDIRFDVFLTTLLEDIADLSAIVDDLENRLQRHMAPKLADCLGYRRGLSDENNKNSDRQLAGRLERNVIGNAQFFLEYQQECHDSASCMRIRGELNLYLKADQDIAILIEHIKTTLANEDLTAALQLTASFDNIEVDSIPFVPVPTLAPTETPFLYEPNSPEDCETIASGLPVPDQDLMIPYHFDLTMSVLLTLQVSDVSEVVNELESKMQQILAPILAGCPLGRRLGETDAGTVRELLLDYRMMIGNAQFQLIHRESEACDPVLIAAQCIRLDARLTLGLKGEEDSLPLANYITGVLGSAPLTETLELTAPFNVIEVAGVTAAVAPTNPPANSPEVCAAIASGLPVPDQDLMIFREYFLTMSVLLTLQLSNVSEVIIELESKMQQILAPMIANCPEVRRLGETDLWGTRELVDDLVIENVQFQLIHRESQSCDPVLIASQCIRVDARLSLFLNREEASFRIVGRIYEVIADRQLVDVLGLSAPFEAIEQGFLRVFDPTSAPSGAPTIAEDSPSP